MFRWYSKVFLGWRKHETEIVRGIVREELKHPIALKMFVVSECNGKYAVQTHSSAHYHAIRTGLTKSQADALAAMLEAVARIDFGEDK